MRGMTVGALQSLLCLTDCRIVSEIAMCNAVEEQISKEIVSFHIG